ncbi:MAG: hypothetical protein QOF51_101 [Chloroflexota bacterium]|nr:hypothetical protein [Chloroflexota bacterium]
MAPPPTIAWLALAYLAISLLGVWAAPDRADAWRRFALLALGVALALSIGWIGRRGGDRALAGISVGVGLLATGVTCYFLLTFDWRVEATQKFTALRPFGLWIEGHLPFSLPGAFHPNAAGGALAIVLPFAFGAVAWAVSRRRRVFTAFAALTTLVALVGLSLSVSRGAWLGLAAGITVAGYATWQGKRDSTGPTHWRVDGFLLVCGLVIAVGLWTTITQSATNSFVLAVAGEIGDSPISRVKLWRDIAALIPDYALTGSGFDVTDMVYSSYMLLVHVPYLYHAHNLYLQLAIEQGVPAMISFVILALVSARTLMRVMIRCADERLFAAAALAATVAMLVHGTLDSQLLISPLVPLMFLPLGYALAVRESDSPIDGKVGGPARMRLRVGGAAIALAALGALTLVPQARAIAEANLGAVAQTRAELSVYQWPRRQIQDEVRRSGEADLAPAMGWYKAALRADPTNVTANRRLGQIELSIGQYDAAFQHLRAAFQYGPDERANRLLLGEAYADQGDVESAATIWHTVDVGQGQIALRIQWYRGLQDPQRYRWIFESATIPTP